ncbi:glycosyltransferase family 4 protein [Olsenella sp. An290]|uniref:glycosyltransferase family 4 protein n=1 Tax=Olsenella sp. An290 TaxID=1965625 RepID=UPI001EF67991|nr:glycosyltransferase family 4 protein [Olsenella sp. An290]
MIDEFIRRGAEVVVFGDEPENSWGAFFTDHGVSYFSYRVSRNGINPASDLGTLKELRSLFMKLKPDKVFTYQAKPNIYGAIAAHQAGIGDVYAMMGGLGSVFRATDFKSRIIGVIAGMEYRAALRCSKAVFFQNKEDAELFLSHGLVAQDKVVMTRGSGVNLNQYPVRPLPEINSFLFVGRLVKGKGVFDYLEAARMVKKRYPHAEFHLVGPYDTNPTALKPEELRPYIMDKTVAYHGEQRNVQPFLEASSCFVLPSYYGEGTPKSALEAMATGRPLIVADAVGCREVVRNGENGFLVPPKSPAAIAEAMKRLIEDRELRYRMAEKSRLLAEGLFDVTKVNNTICETMGI